MRALCCCLLTACTTPGVELPPGAPVASLVSITPEGDTPASVRFALTFSAALLQPRIIVITGGATDDDVIALARNKITAALRAREVATTTWSEGEVTYAQPIKSLPSGPSTLVILQERRAPITRALAVLPLERMARRVWTSEKSVTYCGAATPESLTFAPGSVPGRIVPRGPCFDVTAERAIAGLLLPPEIDPAPIGAPSPAPLRPEPPCPESAYPLGPLCVRVDDDRVVLVGGVETQRLVLGSFGPIAIGETLDVGARLVLRGFPPKTNVPIDLLVRDAFGDHRVRQTIATRPLRRHVVINEVLARPPSGATSQRFLELFNDGDRAVELTGLVLHDGADTWELPDTLVAPGAFALITAASYVDGLAGEPAPPKGVERVFVEALRLSGDIAIAEADGTVLSRFPPTTSTKLIARARRTPDTPDDAPDAFVFAPPTPGRGNVIPP